MAELEDGLIPIAEHFGELEDPRNGRAKRHELLDIIVITLCAVICGADNWVEIEEFGKAKREWFDRFLKLPNGIPSHDTFGRVFGMLDPERFAACFTHWVNSVSQLVQGEVVAIDGKTLRGCHDRGNGRGPLHLVSAWATENRMVWGRPARRPIPTRSRRFRNCCNCWSCRDASSPSMPWVAREILLSRSWTAGPITCWR